jgi:dihydrofolate reductase
VPEQWVQSHPGAPFTFVTDGIAAAIERAREIAGDKDVGVNGGAIARQCLELGLLDEIGLDLVPVLLGGVPYFDRVKAAPILLDGPTVTAGSRVTHLHYIVRKP